MIDETHDPALQSWVESANEPGCAFPVQNLPLSVFQPPGGAKARAGVAIGDSILDASEWIAGETLNSFFALTAADRRELRRIWSRTLQRGAPERHVYQQGSCEMRMPAAIGDYTDFYASIEHATNVGSMFRPDNPLLPNYKHVPIGYHGRSSTIVLSGTAVRRPSGQLGEGRFGPSQELDYELELGAFLGPGNSDGEPILIGQAEEHIAGVCLVNDWSARDIQRWEYQPLGPFLAKNFATSISPWVVTMEALAPFRTAARERDMPVLPYLQTEGGGAFDVTLEVWLKTPAMRKFERISSSSSKRLYWTLGQMVAHHASNGCVLRPGDLIASGTVSGPSKQNRGCLLELTWRGKEPLLLSTGEQRQFLEDGDEVKLTGRCLREGFVPIGLGDCTGRVVAQAARKHNARPNEPVG